MKGILKNTFTSRLYSRKNDGCVSPWPAPSYIFTLQIRAFMQISLLSVKR